MNAKLLRLKVVHPEVRKILEARAIDPEKVKHLDFAYLDTDEHRHLHPNHPGLHQPGMVIEYLDPRDGSSLGWRTKVIGVYKITGKNGKERELKYLHPKNALIHLYFPLGPKAWDRLLDDVTKPLLITEGELKALCATLLGLPTIGLPGIDSITQYKKPLPDWDWVKLDGRKVTLVADSDYRDKPGVRSSVERAVMLLSERGARVHLWPVDSLPGFEKTGLDDYIKVKGIASASAKIEAAKPADDRTPLIIKVGQLHVTLNLIAAALAKAETPYYRRGSGLVRAEVLDEDTQEDSGFWSPEGSLQLEILTSARLAVDVSQRISLRSNNAQGLPIPKDLPDNVARSFIATGKDFKDFRYIKAISHVPLMREDGTIRLEPGLDPQTGILVDARGFDFSQIIVPDAPTREDALAALAIVKSVFCDFPFDDDASLSVHLAALLSALLRSGIGTTPIFGYSAPSFGAGKTLLAQLVSIIATGRAPSIISMKGNEETFETQIEAALLAATPVVCIDNVDRTLTGKMLAAITTSESYTIRLFHSQASESVLNHTLWIATGVNLRTGYDLKRRSLVSTIDPNVEHPENRQTFRHSNIKAYAEKHRHEILGALFTILRAYARQKPKPKIKRLGSFELWSERVLGPLAWLELADPLVKIAEMNAADPVKESESAVFTALRNYFGAKEFTASDIATSVNDHMDPKNLPLRTAFADLRGAGGVLNAVRVGHWLGHRKGKVLNGLKLTGFRDTNSNISKWQIQNPKRSGDRRVRG